PEAIIIIGAYQPSAVFTQWARKLGVGALIANISFVGANALADAIGPVGGGVYVSQVVPFPDGDAMPLLGEYRAALAAFDPDARPGFVSLEGYIAGRLTVEVLRRLGPEPTRAAFLATLDAVGTFDIGGFVLHYAPDDNRGSEAVFLTRIRSDGSIEPAEEMVR
ncbi:MAG: ABC transporter substrate-binding protein, partial [Rhizobiales bacterium]|nr:ABC transporter substrate-binding protein [Hyphomicrobiales bacterium]